MIDNVLNYYLNPPVTPVTPQKNEVLPLQTKPDTVVTPVIPVTPQKIQTQSQNALSESVRQKLLAWMDAIEETDQEIISDVLRVCAANADKRAWALAQADKALPKDRYPVSQITCRSCDHFRSLSIVKG